MEYSFVYALRLCITSFTINCITQVGEQEWDLRIRVVEYRGSENVTPAEERESRPTGRKDDGRFRT